MTAIKSAGVWKLTLGTQTVTAKSLRLAVDKFTLTALSCPS